MTTGQRKRILILGGGFGGIYCAKKLQQLLSKVATTDDIQDFQITLVSKQNFFVFTPMLPQVVSGTVETNHIVVPIRQILRKTQYIEGEVAKIDIANKKAVVRLEDRALISRSNYYRHDRHSQQDEINPPSSSPPSSISSPSTLTIDYDHLVVSLGSETNFFDMPHLEDSVFRIRNLKDALVLRNHIISMLERADAEAIASRREQMLTFVIVGGGLSGIETATELNDFLLEAIKYYPNIVSGISEAPVKVIVVQSRDRVLPELNSSLGTFTKKRLEGDGIQVMLNSKVVDVDKGYVKILKNEAGVQVSLLASTTIWTTGISPNPIIAEIPCTKPSSGRLPVDQFLRVKGYEDVWAIGDCAYIINDATSEPYPPTAQHAIKESEVIAENISYALTGKSHRFKKFTYKKNAQMAIIGRRTAIASFGRFNFHGFAIWCLWRAVYLGKLPMLKKRLRVTVDWIIDIFFDRDLTHIRGLEDDRMLQQIGS